MNQGFNKYMKQLMNFNNPATMNNEIARNKEIYMKILKILHKRYRSGVVLLLYLVMHDCPKLSNVVRELPKFIDREK